MRAKKEIYELLKIIDSEKYVNILKNDKKGLERERARQPLRKEIEEFLYTLNTVELDELLTSYLVGKEIEMSKNFSSPDKLFEKNINKDILFKEMYKTIDNNFKDRKEKVEKLKYPFRLVKKYLESYVQYYS